MLNNEGQEKHIEDRKVVLGKAFKLYNALLEIILINLSIIKRREESRTLKINLKA